ncbi:hypothetical protein VUR80DRAFT_9610 [Thermomyces stellatus]
MTERLTGKLSPATLIGPLSGVTTSLLPRPAASSLRIGPRPPLLTSACGIIAGLPVSTRSRHQLSSCACPFLSSVSPSSILLSNRGYTYTPPKPTTPSFAAAVGRESSKTVSHPFPICRFD